MHKFIIIILLLFIIFYIDSKELFDNSSGLYPVDNEKMHLSHKIISQTSMGEMHLIPINNYNNIDIYVISLRHKERLKNIEIQKNKIDINNNNFIIYDAVNGNNLDLNQLVESNILSDVFMIGNEVRKREIGCYLSHYNIYNKIKENNKGEYTIIFEDDFILEIDNFMEEINILLNDMATYVNCMNDNSVLLLSGFYTEDFEAINECCEKLGLTFESKKERNNWLGLKYSKN
jgi:GR25 family glycosyltransferase involved in LPS biosynthesis